MANNQYTWVPFFEELADKLLTYKSNRQLLIEKVKEAHQVIKGIDLPTIESDNNNIPDIDPFTVIALFNRGNLGVPRRQKICEGYKKVFDMTSSVPSDYDGVPMYFYNQYCFYRYVGDPKRDDNCFDYFWNLFEQALSYSKNPSNKSAFEAAFDQVMNISLVGQPKLTIGLFHIRPNVFVSLDSNNNAFIEKELHRTVGTLKGAQYLDLCSSVVEYTKAQLNESLPAFSGRAYDVKHQTSVEKANESEPLLAQYNPNPTTEKKETTTMISKNTILFGPPGTGKTYYSAIYAVAIIEGEDIERIGSEPYSDVMKRYNEYTKQGLIKFTTFHQSYGYEEFIEGIKPYTDSDTSELRYRIEPGLFLDFCNENLQETRSIDVFEVSWQKLEKEAYEKGKEYQFTRTTGSKFTGVLVEDAFRVIWKTGTFNTLAKATIRDQWEKKIKRDELTGGNIWAFDARQAIIDEMQKKYDLPKFEQNLKPKEESKRKVFIIDEINRGNISKILGELITLIEETKREQISVILPYSKKLFTVPKNIYIIGTMNTADRSIATLDTALRRRFHFKEMQPKPELLSRIEIEGLNIGEMLYRMNKKISILYDREHTIGHAYFMPLDNNKSVENLANIFAYDIMPLLQEYFYEDYEKIRLVLGDNQKDNEDLQFIKARANDYADLFGDSSADFDESVTYEINNKAFKNIESYRSI